LSSGPVIQLYRNTSLTENKAEVITSPEGDEIAWYVGTNKQRIEFKANLSDLNLDEKFEYFVSFANNVKGNQYTLFAQSLNIGEDGKYLFPYTKWDTENAITFIPKNEEISTDEILEILAELM
jgi:hypothetical protein